MKNKKIENSPKINHKNRDSEGGFTFVELIVTVVILGILVTIAITRYIQLLHTSRAAACKYNQSVLETAQTMYYTTTYLSGNAHYAESLDDLVPFLKNETVPHCPSGGSYQLLSGGKVTCTIPDHKR